MVVVRNPRSRDSACVTVGDLPAVAIGGADAIGPYDLLRVIDAGRLGDGRIAVFNGGTSDLRLFDNAGRHVLTVGRRGSGPGEFRNAQKLLRLGLDTLGVYDLDALRLTLFDTRGMLLRTTTIRDGAHAFLVGRLEDGSLVFSKIRGFREGIPVGTFRDTMRLLRFELDGAFRDTIGTFPGGEYVAMGDRQSVGAMSLAFGRSTSVAVAGTRTYVGDNAEYRIAIYGDDGRLLRIVEKAHRPVPVTAAEIERSRPRAERGPLDAALAPFYDRAQLPQTRPAFSKLVVDAEGWLWVGGYVPAADSSQGWDVFDEAGILRCSVRLVPRFRVFEIGSDYVLGVARDEDGVEQVRLYRLQRLR